MTARLFSLLLCDRECGLPAGRSDLAAARERARQQQEALHPRLHALQSANPPYEVRLSNCLATQSERLRAEIAAKTLA